jgi:tRNA threonylcarbamoyladenosine biosynthesis protein TsaE
MPILAPNSVEFISRSADQTRRVGMRLGMYLADNFLICLEGELGSGKTTFVQGLASGWGSLDQVSSPTFVLINLYRHPEGRRLYHVDAYRLDSPTEAEDLDLDTMLENGSMVIEWAEKIKSILPAEHIWIKLREINQEQRDLIFSARGKRYESILEVFRRRIYGGL